MWKEAARYDAEEKVLRAPLIQVIYANVENQTTLRDIMEVLTTRYGSHEKINTTTGEDYELPRATARWI